MIIFDHVSKVYPNGTVGLDDVNQKVLDAIYGDDSKAGASL